MKKVNVFIVGFMKSGTTAMAHFLAQHPEVCVSIPKEPAYFASDLMKESDEFHGKPTYFKVRDEESYHELFSHQTGGEKAFIDASTAYIYSKDAAKNISKYNPDAKIIIMLRDPVDFLHSLHMQYLNESAESTKDFKRALELEESRRKGKNIPSNVRVPSYLYYSERGKYDDQIKRYYDVFDKSQILVIPTDEFRKDNPGTYKKVAEFINVDPLVSPDFKTVLGSKSPRSTKLNAIAHNPKIKGTFYRVLGNENYTKLVKSSKKLLLKDQQRQKLDPDLRKELEDKFRPSVESASKIVDTDLSKLWGY